MIIAFEGIDGSGKTTQIANLDSYLRSLGHSVKVVKQPGGTPLGEEIRELILKNRSIDPRADLCLFLASHIQGMVEAKGFDYTLIDRSIVSTIAYQSADLGINLTEKILDFYSYLLGGKMIDCLIYLDLDPVTSIKRAMEKNKYEDLGLDFMESVRANYNRFLFEQPSRGSNSITQKVFKVDVNNKDAMVVFDEIRSAIQCMGQLKDKAKS